MYKKENNHLHGCADQDLIYIYIPMLNWLMVCSEGYGFEGWF